MADLWTRSPEFLRGYAEAVRAAAQPMEAAMVAAVLEGFAARLDGVRVPAPAVVAVTPAPVMAAPLPEPPPPVQDAAPAVAPEKPKRKAQEWSEERRQRQREHMLRLGASGKIKTGGGRRPKAAPRALPAENVPVAEAAPEPTPERGKNWRKFSAPRATDADPNAPPFSSEDMHEAREMLAKGKGAAALHEWFGGDLAFWQRFAAEGRAAA